MIQPRAPEDDDALLVGYVDGALDPEQAARAERLIAADPRARETVEVFRRTAALLRSACGEEFYPPPARRAAPARRPAARRLWPMAAAAALLLLAGGFGGGALWQQAADHDPLGEIAEYHGVFSRETAHLVELPPERVDEMASWLGEGGSLGAPNLSAAFRLAGGRMLVIDGQRVAELMYTRPHGPPVGLCIQRAEGGDAPLRLARRGGLQLATWTEAGETLTLVGDLAPAEARAIAARVRAQART